MVSARTIVKILGNRAHQPDQTRANLPGPGGTRAFDILIALQTPFSYDPARGNLLLDFQRDASTRQVAFDSENQGGDSISRIFGSRQNAIADRGVDSVGLVTRFTVEAVPEPATWAMFVPALTVAGYTCWRKRSLRA